VVAALAKQLYGRDDGFLLGISCFWHVGKYQLPLSMSTVILCTSSYISAIPPSPERGRIVVQPTSGERS
jgi:hypothetical protein